MTDTNATRAAGSSAPACSAFYPLFEHMSRAHGVTLVDSELHEICRIATSIEGYNTWNAALDHAADRLNRIMGGDGIWQHEVEAELMKLKKPNEE